MTCLIGAEVHHGIGGHGHHDSPSTVSKLVVVSNDLWILIVNITKASILIQYLRVFSDRVVRSFSILLMILILPAACWGIFGGTFLCSPTARLWRPELPGHCLNAQKYWISVAGLDIGLDFLVLLLPLPAITNLHLPRKQKLGLMLVFLLGFFVCIVSVIRLVTVLIASAKDDFVMSGVWAIIWSTVEANVGIICASLLALKPLVAKLFPTIIQESKPPRHSMRLPMVEDAGGSDEAILTYRRSASVPTTPTTMRSKESSSVKWSRTARVLSSSVPPLSEVEDLDVIEAEFPPPVVLQQGRERVSLFDMLREED